MADTAFQPDAFQQDAFQTHVSIDLPTAVLTLSASLSLENVAIALPTAVLTLSAATPAVGFAVPTAALGLSAGLDAGVSIALPTAALTLSAGIPARGIPLPTAALRLSARISGASSGVIGAGGVPIAFGGAVLFRGQVTAKGATRDKGYLRLALTLEDINRQLPLHKVGAVDEDGLTHTLPDGTLSILDGAWLNYGEGPGDGGVARFLVTEHLVEEGLQLVADTDTHVHTTNPLYSGLPVLRWAYMDVRSVLDDFASRQGPYTRYRIDQDRRLWWTTLAPTGTVGDFAVPAPYRLTGDGPEAADLVMANITGRVELGAIRRRVFIRGGTPRANRWVEDPAAPTFAGDEYIDAPGAVSAEDADAIGSWHLQNRLRPLYSGTAVIRPGFDGWHVMQTLYLTDAILSRDTGFVFADTPTTIQSVSGRLVAPDESGSGLSFIPNTGVAFPLDPIDPNRISWKSFTFAESINGPEKAQLVVELWDPDEEFTLADLAFVTITTDGTAAIEYTIGWGDIPAGSLVRQAEPFKMVAGPVVPPQPATRFVIELENPDLPVGGTCFVSAQAAEQSGLPKAVAEIPVVWILEQWTTLVPPVVGTGYTLAESLGTTDIGGRAYNRVERAAGGTANWFQVKAVAMLILP